MILSISTFKSRYMGRINSDFSRFDSPIGSHKFLGRVLVGGTIFGHDMNTINDVEHIFGFAKWWLTKNDQPLKTSVKVTDEIIHMLAFSSASSKLWVRRRVFPSSQFHLGNTKYPFLFLTHIWQLWSMQVFVSTSLRESKASCGLEEDVPKKPVSDQEQVTVCHAFLSLMHSRMQMDLLQTCLYPLYVYSRALGGSEGYLISLCVLQAPPKSSLLFLSQQCLH